MQYETKNNIGIIFINGYERVCKKKCSLKKEEVDLTMTSFSLAGLLPATFSPLGILPAGPFPVRYFPL